jgi:calcium-dependent protein kinase
MPDNLIELDYNQSFIEDIIKKIMNNIDNNGNGKIDFSEFILASIDKNSFLTSEKIKKAFDILD